MGVILTESVAMGPKGLERWRMGACTSAESESTSSSANAELLWIGAANNGDDLDKL